MTWFDSIVKPPSTARLPAESGLPMAMADSKTITQEESVI